MKHIFAFPVRGALALAVVASLALGGCASTPRTSALLADAQAAYERAQSDAAVAGNSAIELQRARSWITTPISRASRCRSPSSVRP